jgi:predicted transposase/invertase (TIGR01784 family)
VKGKKSIQKEDVVFADPTYDITFKMLFGNNESKDILISFLNSLLNLDGDKKIVEVFIVSNELQVESFFKEKGKSGIKSAVDVLCTTTTGQQIAVEMQHKQKEYFLTRTQEYMSKLIAGQVKEGQGELYHKAVMDTYILVIGKENMFRGEFALKDQSLFEVDIVPTVKQTGEEMPGNKMHWKFFELLKFAKTYKNVEIDNSHSLKEQWLDFFLKCSTQEEVPANVNDIIKKGYNIMKMANLTHEQKALYWMQKQDELDTLEQIEIEKKEAVKEATQLAFKDGFKDGEFKGFKEGEFKGKIKGEIKQIKSFMDLEKQMSIEIPKETYTQKLNYTKTQFEDIKNYLNDGHFNDTETVIGDNLHLFDMDIEY